MAVEVMDEERRSEILESIEKATYHGGYRGSSRPSAIYKDGKIGMRGVYFEVSEEELRKLEELGDVNITEFLKSNYSRVSLTDKGTTLRKRLM